MVHKILIVDDEPYIRVLLEQTLEDMAEDHHITLLSATNGLEAWQLMQQHNPDLIFLDIMMPEMTGLEVCEKVRESGNFPDTPIILLTARGQEVDRQQGLATGARHYITKPFDPDEIVALAMQELGIIA